MIIATDLEGVLIPEIWVEIADYYDVDDLRKTTRDIPQFENLMEHRVEVLRRENLSLEDLNRVARDVEPYEGSEAFLEWCHRRGQVMVISDTFHEFSDEIVRNFGGYNLFANRFVVDESGMIDGYHLRIRGMKWNVLEKLHEIGFFIVAIGDSHNDVSMLREADHPILYNPPEELVERHPEFHVASSYREVRESIESVESIQPVEP
jgi:phosphoserine/homoserine phosphotransferase